MLPIFILRELGLSPASMGVIFSLGAVGGLLGAIATPHIVRLHRRGARDPDQLDRIQRRRRLPARWPRLVPSVAFPLLVAQCFVASFTVLLYNITQVTFRQRITPPRLLGRMNASVRFVVWGVMPIAALLSGSARHLARSRAHDVDRRDRPAVLARCSWSSGRSGRCATCPMSESADARLSAAARTGHARADSHNPFARAPLRGLS